MTAPGWGDERSRPQPPPPAEEPPSPDEPASPDGDAPLPPGEGPPGAAIFSLAGRRAPGLYLAAWLLAGTGLLLAFFVGPLASSETAGLALIVFGLVLSLLGVAAGAGSQVMERQDRHPGRYRGPSPLLAFAAWLLLIFLVGLLLAIAGIRTAEETPGRFLLVAGIQTAAYVLVMWLFAVRTGASTAAAMGWPTWVGSERRSLLRAVGIGIGLMLPATFAIGFLGAIVGAILGVEPANVVPIPESSLEVVMVAVVVVILAPAGEELFFRGFMLTAWMQDLGARSALLRSATLFAVVHLAGVQSSDPAEGAAQSVLTLVVLFPVGLVFGWLFVRYGLLSAMAAHATYNSFALLWLLAQPAGS